MIPFPGNYNRLQSVRKPQESYEGEYSYKEMGSQVFSQISCVKRTREREE